VAPSMMLLHEAFRRRRASLRFVCGRAQQQQQACFATQGGPRSEDVTNSAGNLPAAMRATRERKEWDEFDKERRLLKMLRRVVDGTLPRTALADAGSSALPERFSKFHCRDISAR
jgi:hypothetical protein